MPDVVPAVPPARPPPPRIPTSSPPPCPFPLPLTAIPSHPAHQHPGPLSFPRLPCLVPVAAPAFSTHRRCSLGPLPFSRNRHRATSRPAPPRTSFQDPAGFYPIGEVVREEILHTFALLWRIPSLTRNNTWCEDRPKGISNPSHLIHIPWDVIHRRFDHVSMDVDHDQVPATKHPKAGKACGQHRPRTSKRDRRRPEKRFATAKAGGEAEAGVTGRRCARARGTQAERGRGRQVESGHGGDPSAEGGHGGDRSAGGGRRREVAGGGKPGGGSPARRWRWR